MTVINQKLEQKQIQKLSPQQIQLIKLLEVPIIELEQRIKKEIEENPALEESKELDEETPNNESEDSDLEYEEENDKNRETEFENDSYTNNEEEYTFDDYYGEEDEMPNYKLKDNNYAEDTDIPQNYYSVGSSFQEYMYEQLSDLELNENDLVVAEYLIGSLDESGYLRRDVVSIKNDLILFYNTDVQVEKIEKVLFLMQEQLEPAGVMARNLQESLILQVKRKLYDDENNDTLNNVLTILTDFFDEFSKKHYDKITNKLDLDNDQMRDVIKEIIKLNPKPGNAYSPQNKKNIYQIVPDFVLHNYDDELIITLNSLNIPPLRISKTYEGMLKTFQSDKESVKRNKETINFVKNKLDSAKWFIDAIKQRQNTLLNTMESILKYQLEFFKTGDESKLNPMILKDIAEKTNLDISTISRVANSKYIQTPFGIYPLKFFFSEGMENSDGEEVSTRKIKKILKEAIEQEDKNKPLTDEKLAKLLQDKGYLIARRTVAKYREQMGILVARLRKKI